MRGNGGGETYEPDDGHAPRPTIEEALAPLGEPLTPLDRLVLKNGGPNQVRRWSSAPAQSRSPRSHANASIAPTRYAGVVKVERERKGSRP